MKVAFSRRDRVLALFRKGGGNLGRRGPLRGAYREVADYQRKAPRSLQARVYGRVVESSVVDRGLPCWSKGFPPDFFSSQRRINSPAGWVADLPSARVFTHRGSVLSRDHRLLFDLSPQHSLRGEFGEVYRHHAMRRLFFPPPEKVAGTVLSLLTPAGGNFFHWMTEVLPRLQLARWALPDLFERMDLCLVNRDTGFAAKTLSWLGVPGEKVRVGRDAEYLQANSLIVPSLPGVTNATPRWVLDWMREAFLPMAKAPDSLQAAPWIYIARGKSPRRRIINEDEWIRYLEGLGFTTIYPEDYSLEEQVWIFAQARCVVGAHGAGLTNLVWCQPGTRVWELFLNDHFTPAYWSISNTLGLNYGLARYALSDSERKSGRQVGQDVSLPLGEVRQDFDAFLEQATASTSSRWTSTLSTGRSMDGPARPRGE
jgi:hypothetical protein